MARFGYGSGSATVSRVVGRQAEAPVSPRSGVERPSALALARELGELRPKPRQAGLRLDRRR
jgi:hypothetical protein